MLSKKFDNWITGMSSPWIGTYGILEVNQINGLYLIKLKFDTKTSTGPYKAYYATLKIKKENRIL